MARFATVAALLVATARVVFGRLLVVVVAFVSLPRSSIVVVASMRTFGSRGNDRSNLLVHLFLLIISAEPRDGFF